MEIKTGPNGIESQRMPLAFLSFDKRRYSKNNWGGINPFIYISNIKIGLIQENTNKTLLRITLGRTRTIGAYSYVMLLSSLVLLSDAGLWVSIPVFLLVGICFYSLLFLLISEYFIKLEIKNAISPIKSK
jgi:hypothetical protein